jgi:hypothetical protein
LLPPIDTATIRTLWVEANSWSISAWPRPAGVSAKSSPGLKLPSPSVNVAVRAPEQARLALPTPWPM